MISAFEACSKYFPVGVFIARDIFVQFLVFLYIISFLIWSFLRKKFCLRYILAQ